MAFAAALPALTAIGAGLSAAGTISGGIAAQNAANYQAQVARNNAAIADANAVRTEQAGAAAAENQGRKGAARSGALKVAQASNGVDVNTGSSVDVQTGERQTNQLDTENVFANSELHAYGYRTQATNFEADAELDKAKADNAVPAALLKASGSLLSSASSLGGKWTGTTSSGTGGGDPVYAPDDI